MSVNGTNFVGIQNGNLEKPRKWLTYEGESGDRWISVAKIGKFRTIFKLKMKVLQ